MSAAVADRRRLREIISGETIVLAECEQEQEQTAPVVSNRCVSLQGRALLRIKKVEGSDGIYFQNGDIVQIECGIGLMLRGHTLSKYISWTPTVNGSNQLNEKALFRIEGLEDETSLLRSQTPFRLVSTYWPKCYLTRETQKSDFGFFFSGDRNNSSSSRSALMLVNEEKTKPLYFCALPARLSYRGESSDTNIRDMLDRTVQKEHGGQYAYITRFRTVRVEKKNNKIVHMDKLSIFEVEQSDQGKHHDCSICLCNFSPGDKCCILPCAGQHQFHVGCIESWLKVKTSCPLCVSEIMDVVTDAPEKQKTRRRSSLLRRIASAVI